MTLQPKSIKYPAAFTASHDTSQIPRSLGMRAGNLLFLSGMVSTDPKTGDFFDGTVTQQTRAILTQLADVLREAGTSLENAVKVTINLTDILDHDEMNTVYCDFFSGDKLPARTVCAVKLLKGAKVEIECVAALPMLKE